MTVTDKSETSVCVNEGAEAHFWDRIVFKTEIQAEVERLASDQKVAGWVPALPCHGLN